MSALVLSTGHPPEPPPAFDVAASAEGDFEPPISKAAADAKPTPTVPKVLASGLPPKPPPTFDVSTASSEA